MTNEEAIKILRTEQLGDSEQMELAKQMGADALERQQLHFVAPKCENCGRYILSVAISYGVGYFDTISMKSIDPNLCPYCGTVFVRADIDYKEQTCILRGGGNG